VQPKVPFHSKEAAPFSVFEKSPTQQFYLSFSIIPEEPDPCLREMAESFVALMIRCMREVIRPPRALRTN
jgi:hypothetical protein